MPMELRTGAKTGRVYLSYFDGVSCVRVMRTFESIDHQVRELLPRNIQAQVGVALARLGKPLEASRSNLARVILDAYHTMRSAEARRREIWKRTGFTIAPDQPRRESDALMPARRPANQQFVALR